MITAMHILKEEIERKVFPSEYNDSNLTDYQYGHNVAYGVVLTLIEFLIEKEKEQIIDACNSILEDSSTWGERYYKQKYQNNNL